MATKFKKGDEVKVNQVLPQGPVKALRMDDDGAVYCLIEWVDATGDSQKRWFSEDDLTVA
jgi:uncharacterized protein YodC (DUF2158 family)